ncbi:chloride channel protein [Halomonas sp. KM072]
MRKIFFFTSLAFYQPEIPDTPEIQGIGYDSLAAALNNQLTVSVLLALMIGKLLITALTVAGGVPIGIIGPVLVSGAATGALAGMLGGWLWPDKAADPGIYAMLGMAAMMGAVLQAPLAALMALLELTHTPHMMLPGMLAVVVACLTSRQLTGCEGFFVSSVRYGMHPLQQPLMQALSRVSVPAVMERSLVRTERMITLEQARQRLETNPTWLVIERSSDDKPVLGLKAAELARWLLEHDEALKEGAAQEEELIDLLEIPGQRLEMAPIGLQATLSEAFLKLQDNTLDALYVIHGYRPKQQRISGIITRGAIERYYHYTDTRHSDPRDPTVSQ